MIAPAGGPGDPRLAADAAPVGLLLLDREGETVFANARASAVLGVSGRTPALLDAVRPEARAAVADQVASALAGDGASVQDHPRLHPDGHERWLRLWASPVPAGDGEVEGVVVALDDITQDRRQQRETRMQSLGQLAGTVAHDLNNLLTGILGNLALAQLEVPEASEGAQVLGDAQQSAERAAALAAQLLGFSGRGAAATGTVDLDAAVRRAVESVRESLPPDVRLDVLGAAPSPVEGDAARLVAMLGGLLRNAVDALDGRPGAVRVRVSGLDVDAARKAGFFLDAGLAEGTAVAVEVIDTGAGMTETVRERMLEPFFTTRGKGRGLGHNLTVAVLRAHRAALEVHSAPGIGTTVRVLLRPRDAAVQNGALAPKLGT